MAAFFMRGKMAGMKYSSIRDLLFLVVIVAQPFAISGCMDRFRAADKQVEAAEKRMKQIEKEASNPEAKLKGSED